MTLRPYKFQIVAVVQNVNAGGEVIGESTVGASDNGTPFTVFGTDALAAWAKNFPAMLAAAEPQVDSEQPTLTTD